MGGETNTKISQKPILRLLIVLVLMAGLFAILSPQLGTHHVHKDERYYIGRAMQNIEFMEGNISAGGVWFSSGNHPFTAELIIGLSLVVQGQDFSPPHVPWATNLTASQLLAARETSLLIGLIGMGSLIFVALDFNPLIIIPAMFFLLSSPGLLDILMMDLLDIYVASFTALTLASLYFYLVKGNKNGLWFAAIFLGLALGSKTSWDSLVAGLVVLIALVHVEYQNGFNHVLRTLGKTSVVVALSFVITNPVILFRIGDDVKDILVFRGRLSLGNLLVDQPIVSTKSYTVFLYQLPVNLMIFGIVLAGVMVVSSVSFLINKLNNDRLAKYVAIIAIFVSLDLILTGSTFEFGLNYARLSLYETLLLVVLLGFFVKLKYKIGLMLIAIAAAITGYSLESYLTTVGKSFAKTGLFLVPYPMARGTLYAPDLGWFLLSLVTLAIPILIVTKLSPSWHIVLLLSRWRKH